MFHWIALGIQLVGLAVVVVGSLRIARAPATAARRASTGGAGLNDGPRYTRGLTDFYRISGAVAVLAGVVLLLVPFFAG